MSAPEKQLRPTQIPGQLYRPQRQARYEKLLHEGFLGFEARPLSEIKFKVPYMKELRKARLIEYRQARQAKVKKADYVARILARYEDNLWVRETKYNQLIADPWRMVKQFESKYKLLHPEYKSPTKKEIAEAKRLQDMLSREEHGKMQRGM
jgi:hypothetical protein